MYLEQFLNVVLPSAGYRCIATPNTNGFGFAHHVLDNNSQAAKRAGWISNQGRDAFFALGSLREHHVLGKRADGVEKKQYRVKSNILALKSLWLDLDVGEGDKKYATKEDAISHLYEFLNTFQLPTPIIVESGYGAHVYFPLVEDLPEFVWSKVAWSFHSLVTGFGLKADPSRTHDSSSVLRCIGTFNYKDKNAPRIVQDVYTEYQVSSVKDLLGKIVAGIKTNNYPILKASASKQPGLNNDLVSGIYDNSASAELIANKCGAIRHVKDTSGNVPEPLWYAAIGVLRYTLESPRIIHTWSSGHPQYSKDDTDRKIQQHVESGSGPTTCTHFKNATDAGEICNKCPYYGTVTSPIQFGKEVQQPVQPSVVPEPEEVKSEEFATRDIGMFELSKAGVVFKDSFEPGCDVEEESKVRLLEYPIYIKSSAEDERKGGVIQVEYKHPLKGISGFYMEKSTLAEKASFNKEMLKNHVTISPGKVELMREYMISYLQELDRSAELQTLYGTMGWKDNGGFVLGSRFLQKDKEIQNSNLSMHLEGNYCRSIEEVGDWKAWSDMTQLLKSPGLENHALSLLLGFGAPLMPMTGFDGVLINLLGPSGTGKSTMLEMISSIYGKYKDLKAQKEDTYNDLMYRLGTLNNLPMVIDEVTNYDFNDVSSLVYNVSQGREKARMTAKITSRKPLTWSTLVICSSNASLSDKLMAAKADPDAEKMRLVEYWMADIPQFESVATKLHEVMKHNYGGIGTLYIQYVLNNYEAVEKFMRDIQARLEDSAKTIGKERFWVAAFTAALTGGFIAEKLGLIQFPVTPLFEHSVKLLQGLRGAVISEKVDYTSILGRFLNNHSPNVIFVRYGKSNQRKIVEAVFEPQRDLIIRVEHDGIGKRVFVDKQVFIKWLNKANISTTEFIMDAKKSGLMINLNNLKILGQDWANNPNNAPVPTMEFYLKDSEEVAEQIGNNVLAMVK